MKKVIHASIETVQFTFDGLLPVNFDVTKVTQANRDYAMLHGFAARIGDNAAIQKSAENGYKVTEAMRREAVMELVTHYESGSEDWSPKAKARGETFNPHIQTIAEARNCSYGEAQVWFVKKLLAEVGAKAEAPVIDVESREVGGQLAIAG